MPDEEPFRRLVLWDIDGTLVDSARLGREAFVEAFETVTGRPAAGPISLAGRTDLEIARDMLETAGLAWDDGLLASFGDALESAMAARSQLLRERGHAYAGAHEALARLDREPGVVQSILTGNIEPNAGVKLGAFGLDRHLDFEIGAYGSDHHMRGELVAIARGKAERKLGLTIAPEQVVVMGDTPLDVAAARKGGARAVGVANGPFEVGALLDAGADSVLPDLTDAEAVVSAVLAR
jgi:phosphoglycolate phosphatase-like HAD superfamily hydrolase